jgi:hypothetical protein
MTRIRLLFFLTLSCYSQCLCVKPPDQAALPYMSGEELFLA